MRRLAAIALAVTGPLCVAVLRLILPYYTASDASASARAVAAHPGRESVVLWLGLIATVTLVPGLMEVRARFPRTKICGWAFGLTTVGYLALPVVLVADAVLWAGASEGLDPAMTGRLDDGLHPTYDLALGIFVLSHVVGTTMIGLLALQRRTLRAPAAWALTVSQPLHFLATVFLGSPVMDAIAWTLTAVTMGMLASGPVLQSTVPDQREQELSTSRAGSRTEGESGPNE